MTTASSIQQASLTTSSSSSSVDKTVALTNGTSTTSTSTTTITKQSKYKNFIELKEREEFLHKLKEFHKLKGSPINNFPTLNGKLIDLHALYQKVISYGGWEKVCEKEKWDELAAEFNIPTSCSNGSHALKIIYLRYLSLYEKIIFFGEDTLVKDVDEEEDGRRKFNHILKSVPMSYNNYQHGAAGGTSMLLNGIMNGGGGGGVSISPAFNSILVNNDSQTSLSNCEKLENSLTSGLPNEIDFVFNTMLILSNDDSFSFRINGTCTRLVDLILAHIGFFGDDIYNYRRLYDLWRKHSNRNFVKFWHDTIKTNNKDIQKLLPVLYNKFLNELPSQDLLNLRQENGMSNVESQRIEQAMVILNNLSFDENNLDYLSKSKTLFQYLLMSSHCTYSDIRKLSLDILSNICHKILLRTLAKDDLNRLFATIKQLLLSNDRYEIIRGFEIITKLCLLHDNEEFITMNLDNDVYEIISQLLTVQDFLLLTYGLECLYQLSQFSEIVCNQLLSSSKSIISLLISYLTVDSTYFQTSSLKMLDIKHNPKMITTQQQQQQPIPSTVASPSVVQLALQNKIQQSNNQIVSSYQINLQQQHQQQTNASNMQEQQARFSLSNWFKNCFIFNTSYQISKTELYCYYKYIAKVNNWITFPIPTFFELLQQTFPLVKTDDNANTITGLKLVVNNIQSNINNQQQPAASAVVMSPKPQQQIITVNNNIQQQPAQHQQIQIVRHVQQATSPQPQPAVQVAAPVVIVAAPVPQSVDNVNNNNKTNEKTLQLNINESSSSSTFSTSSSSSSTSCPSVTVNKEVRNSCDEDLNNIKENINFTKLNENLKITENSYLDKLEKVGEAEPALNILCNHKNIKLTKIERLVNEVAIVKNGNTNGGRSTSETSSSSEDDEEEGKHKPAVKVNGGLVNGNESQHEVLTNGHHNDESDGVDSKIKLEEEEMKTEVKTNGSGSTEHVNGYVKVINGDSNGSSSSGSGSSVESSKKLNEKKRKKSTDSSSSSSTNTNKNSNNEENVNTPGKKRQKKINEMDIVTTVAVVDTGNKIVVNSVEQQQQQQPQSIPPPVTTNIQQAINNSQQTLYIQQQQPIQYPQQQVFHQQQQQQPVNNNSNDLFLCEWNNCKMAFANAKLVYNHVFKQHLLHLIHTDNSRVTAIDNGINCLWTGCDHVKRQKWALISHLQERHCTEQALRNSLMCRQKNIVLQTQTPSINPNIAYSKDAAFYAIYRSQRSSAEDYLRMEDQSIAKSIRLLAALCLRNLAANSPLAKRSIKQHESLLTNIAFDLVESSNAIANCLWQLTH